MSKREVRRQSRSGTSDAAQQQVSADSHFGAPELETLIGPTRVDMVRALQVGGDSLFAGPGGMRAMCRALAWEATPLGPTGTWPTSLRMIVRTLLASKQPMCLWWGPLMVQIYNDAYGSRLGHVQRTSRPLGASTQASWPRAWAVIGPQIARVMADGEGSWWDGRKRSIGHIAPEEERDWTGSLTPAFDDDGAVGGVLLIGQETTARPGDEISRGQYVDAQGGATSILEAMRDAHATLDHEFRFVTVNRAAERSLSQPRDELFGRAYWDVLPGSLDSNAGRAYRRVDEEGAEMHLVQREVGEGSHAYREIDAYPTDAAGVAIFWRDVTDRVRSERFQQEISGLIVDHNTELSDLVDERARLLKAEHEAREAAETAMALAAAANRAKGEFLAIMSHELRTPLNAIGGYVELIEMGLRGPVTEAQRHDLARIQKSQRHLLGLINGVLNYAKVEGGHVFYEVEAVAIDEVVATAEALIAPQARKREITLRFEGCSPDLVARADREKLQQVLLNVLSNAVKFTEPGGSVTLSCGIADGHVTILVADTGCGIRPDQCDRVFEPFVQVDPRLTRTRDGTGLGLAISRDLARGMGGDLTLQSTLGIGSTFTLTLPLAVG